MVHLLDSRLEKREEHVGLVVLDFSVLDWTSAQGVVKLHALDGGHRVLVLCKTSRHFRFLRGPILNPGIIVSIDQCNLTHEIDAYILHVMKLTPMHRTYCDRRLMAP